MTKIHVVGRIKIMPGKLEQAKAIAAAGIAGLQEREPGTLGMECYINAAGDRVHLSGDLQGCGRAQGAHGRAWLPPSPSSRMIFQITAIEVFGDVPAAQKKVLAPFNTTYFKSVAGLGY